MLEKMSRVQIVGLRGQLEDTTALLGELGVLHVEDAAATTRLASLAADGSRARLQEDLSFLQARLDSLLQLLPASPPPGVAGAGSALPRNSAELAEHLRGTLDELAPPLQELARRRDDLEAEALALPRYEAMMQELVPLAAALQIPPDHDTLALFIERRYRGALDLLRAELAEVTEGQARVAAHDVDENTTAALVVYPHAYLAAVQTALSDEQVTQVRLPKELAGHTFHDARVALEQRHHVLRSELNAIAARLDVASRTWRGRLETGQQEVERHLQALAVQAQFAATEHTFVIEGWLPRRELPRLRERLRAELGGLVVVDELPIDAHAQEHAPVALVNPPALRPFERLVRIVGVPRPGSIDPTILLAVFLPLFFGIIVGDIGYGALLLLLALFLRRRFAQRPLLRDLGQLLIYGSLWAILWGVLYGELFGTLQYQIGLQPIWIPRTGEQIVTLFLFAIGVGALHVGLGIILGLWGAWRERHHQEILTKVGMLVALMALFGLIGALTDLLPAGFFTPTIVALVVGIVLLIVPLGPMGILLGPLELVETISNILSYLRLAAVGLASVYIALVANEMVGVFGNLVLGGIVAVLLHTLNFAILMLSPSIQSLRLHYVELFRQFYKPGGIEYRPFRL